MNATVRPGAGTHAPATTPKQKSFSRNFPEIFGRNDPVHDWDIRPVLVLSTKRDGNRVSTWHPEETSSFIHELKKAGFVGSQCNEIELDRYPLDYVWPRNMEWKPLPTLATPTFRHHFVMVIPLGEDGKYAISSDAHHWNFNPDQDYELQKVHRSIGTGVELVVVTAEVLDDHDLRSATAAYDDVKVDRRPRFVHFDGQAFADISPDRIERIRKRFLPQERFIYNHAVNMNVMGARALLSIGKQRGWNRRIAQSLLPKFTHMAWDFGHPLVLQMLFAIRKSGPVAPDTSYQALIKLNYGQEPLVLARGLPFTWQNGDRFDFVWTGSGKYPRFVEDLGVVAAETAGLGSISMEPAGDELFKLCRNLIRTGLIGLDGSRVAITESGARFLDLVGSEADDPDVLLRWRSETGELVADEHVEEMDRWCNRVFRAMKRKVADLPASIITEDTGTAWQPEPENTVVVRGTVIPATDQDLTDPNFVAYLKAAEEEQRTLGLHEMRRGVIRESQPLDREAMVYALWIGIPMAILDSAQVYSHAADLFKDMSGIDAECRALIEAADLVLPAHSLARKRIETVEAFKTSERPVFIRVIPNELMVEEGDEIVDVIMGKVVQTERKADDAWEMSAFYDTYLRGWGPKDNEVVSGLRCYGEGKPKITFSYGILVGRLNARTGQLAYRKSVPKREAANLEDCGPNLQLRALLENSDFSEDGIWHVFPDGRVEKQGVERMRRTSSGELVAVPQETPPGGAEQAKSQEAAVNPSVPVAEEVSAPDDVPESADAVNDGVYEGLASLGAADEVLSRPRIPRTKSNPAQEILDRIYKEEWLRIADREGFLAKARRSPMTIGSFLGVPDNHVEFISKDYGMLDGEKPICRLVTVTKMNKEKSEAEYAQELRRLLADGNSVVFVGKEEGHVPSIFSANGPIFQPDYNAFEVAARVLLRLETELEEKKEKPIEIVSGDQTVSMMGLAVRKDGSVLVDGVWEKVFVPAKFIGGIFNFLRRAVTDRSLNLDAMAAMRLWAERSKIKGIPHGEGPASLKEIPGIGRVRRRLEALYAKMEGDGSKIGIVFHGPPGTGKTMLARTLARDTGRHFVLGSFAEWQSSGSGHLGDMLKAIKATFAEAKANQPALLFIDEMDSLGDRTKLESKSKEYITAVINAFLEHVQGFHSRGDVVVVGATNDLSRLDPAITRSGRLGEHVRIGLPDRQELGEIVRWYLDETAKKVELAGDIDPDRISDLLDGSSPADVAAVMDNARNAAEFEDSPMTVGHVLHSINTAAGTTMNAASSEFFSVHEAARLTALHLMTDITRMVACVRSRPGVSSATGIVFDSGTSSAMSSDLVMHLKANLAGMAASTIVNSGTADIGSIARPCIEQARRIASELISLGMGSGNKISFVAMTNAAALDKAVTEWLEWAYNQALDLLSPHGETILKVAREIREREHIGTTGIIEILSGCGLSCRR